MVAGSNKLLDNLCQEDGGYVTVDVLPRQNKENNPGYFECKQIESSLFGGTFYEVHGLDGFSRDLDLPSYPLRSRSLSKIHLH